MHGFPKVAEDEIEVYQTGTVSACVPKLNSESTHKLQIKKFVPYVPIIIPLPSSGISTHARIKHTNSAVPITKSRMKWNGVPVRPPA